MTEDELRQQVTTLPGVVGASFWDGKRHELRLRILEDNPAQFLRWPTITSTMYVGNAPYIDAEYLSLPTYYLPLLREPDFGNPSETNTNFIHQAYHLAQWEEKSGKRIRDLGSIIDFGGGYGAMAMMCRRLGFAGRYQIIDSPEFALLQQWYLSNVLSDTSWVAWDSKPSECDLFIAAHSLSEAPVEDRLIPSAKSYLFVYHSEHDGIDNQVYFDSLIAGKPDYQWHNWTTPHLVNQQYLTGWQR